MPPTTPVSQDVVLPKLDPIGKLFKDTTALFKKHFVVSAQVFAVPAILFALGGISVALKGVFAAIGILFYLPGIVFYVAGVVALVFVIGKEAGWKESYKQAFGIFFSYVWLIILTGLCVWGGIVLLIVPGIIMSVQFLFAAYLLVFEGRKGLSALLQSKEYVRGYWWALFGRILLLGLILNIGTSIVQGILQASVGASVATVVGLALLFFTIPYSIAYNVLLFRNLQSLKPELASFVPQKGRGYLIFTAILGFVVPVIMVVLIIFGLVAYYAGNRFEPTPGPSNTSTSTSLTSVIPSRISGLRG